MFAKKAATWSRLNCLRNTALPRSFAPWTWNTFLARSMPIVVSAWWTLLPFQVADTRHSAVIGWGRPSHCLRRISGVRGKTWPSSSAISHSRSWRAVRLPKGYGGLRDGRQSRRAFVGEPGCCVSLSRKVVPSQTAVPAANELISWRCACKWSPALFTRSSNKAPSSPDIITAANRLGGRG